MLKPGRVALLAVLVGLLVAAPILPTAHASSPTAVPVIAGAAHATGTASVARSTSGPTSSAMSLLNALHASRVNPRYAYLPNLNAVSPTVGNSRTVAPLYSRSPAPMGVSDIGLLNESGVNVGTVLNSSSIVGTINLTSAQAFYLSNDAPHHLGFQLNDVLTHVMVHGSTNYVYWNQNVVDYDTATQTLSFIDNIWNFTSAGATVAPADIFSGSGTVVASVGFYYALGPTLRVPTPFSLRLYTNSTVAGLRPTVFFNYSLQGPTGPPVSGSYDEVAFNSTGSTPPVTAAPAPYYQVNGQRYNGMGLLNDAELILGGPGGGSTTNVFNLSGSLDLAYLNNTTGRYYGMPSAYGFGSDTGETVEGVSEWWSTASAPLVHLSEGPSFLLPFWNISLGVAAGDVQFDFTIVPSNGFAFATIGAYTPPLATWAPFNATGVGRWQLPPGGYAFDFQLSGYQENQTNVSSTPIRTTVDLVRAPARGIYTPLWAWNNGQLAAISEGGTGTLASPYLLFNSENSSIHTEFGEMNDFLFPAFPGIQLVNTNAWVDLNQPPAFSVSYPGYVGAELNRLGLPLTGNLMYQFYNVTHVSIWQAPVISGWLASFLASEPVASVVFWNSSDNLVGGNRFLVQSQALLLYGGTNNMIWNNSLLPSIAAAPSGTYLLNYGRPLGIIDSESGDLVYNNNLSVPVPALTPTTDIYTGANVHYQDTWNVSYEAASVVRTVNGYSLSGSVLGLPYQAGNAWANYGSAQDPYGVLPYNDTQAGSATGLITFHGDYLPLTATKLWTVTFSEGGLPAGTDWSVTLAGLRHASTTGAISFVQLNGTYPFFTSPVGGYAPVPANGLVTVNDGGASVFVRFSNATFPVKFTESGLAAGTPWTVTLGGASNVSLATSLDFTEYNGSYPFTVSASGYSANPATGTVVVLDASETVPVVFTAILGTLAGTVFPATASLFIDGVPVVFSNGAFSVPSLAVGVHSVLASAPGYYPYQNNVSIASGGTTTLAVVLDLRGSFPSSAPGNLTGTVAPGSSTVLVNGSAVSVVGGHFATSLRPGVYPVEASSPGYYPYFNNATVAPAGTTSLAIVLDPQVTKGGGQNNTGVAAGWPPTTAEALFGGLVAAAIAIAAGIVIAGVIGRRRRKSEPTTPWNDAASGSESTGPPGDAPPADPAPPVG